jgi:hypothetical protein
MTFNQTNTMRQCLMAIAAIGARGTPRTVGAYDVAPRR